MSFFQNAHVSTISGGQFGDVHGNNTVNNYDNRSITEGTNNTIRYNSTIHSPQQNQSQSSSPANINDTTTPSASHDVGSTPSASAQLVVPNSNSTKLNNTQCLPTTSSTLEMPNSVEELQIAMMELQNKTMELKRLLQEHSEKNPIVVEEVEDADIPRPKSLLERVRQMKGAGFQTMRSQE